MILSKLTTVFLCGGGVTALLGWRLSRRSHIKRLLTVFLWSWTVIFWLSSGYSYWYHHRPHPKPVHGILFEGVTYTRDVRSVPRPLVLHVVTVRLDAPGISFLVTPCEPNNGHQLRARTTSQFLREFGVQVAINAGFFYPWYAHGPLWYYPHVNDPTSVYGLTMSQGHTYSRAESPYTPIYFSEEDQVSIEQPVEHPYNAISGIQVFLKKGQIQASLHPLAKPYAASPRTAVALDKSGKQFMIFVVDGRQPNYSEGLSLPELAQIALEYGADTALNLDGGGSSTLVIEDSAGEAVVLNSPIHGRVPSGRERPVANHLGIFAQQQL